MIFGDIIITKHSIKRYRERILPHYGIDKDISDGEVIKMMYKDLNYRSIKEIVNFGNDLKFVFTRNHKEFRFEKSNNGKRWVLLTVVRYRRMFAHEEPLEDAKGIKQYGINHEIEYRKKQKIKYEKNGEC